MRMSTELLDVQGFAIIRFVVRSNHGIKCVCQTGLFLFDCAKAFKQSCNGATMLSKWG